MAKIIFTPYDKDDPIFKGGADVFQAHIPPRCYREGGEKVPAKRRPSGRCEPCQKKNRKDYEQGVWR